MSARLDINDSRLRASIAQRILELRESTGKGQAEFARDFMLLDKQALHRIEKGRGASIYVISKFCNAIGISLSDFFNSPLFR
jgi:transcriptional regulator with XRE-family HTH domain